MGAVYITLGLYNTYEKAKCNFRALIILELWAVLAICYLTGNLYVRDFYSYLV